MHETPITLEMANLLLKENEALREKLFQMEVLILKLRDRLRKQAAQIHEADNVATQLG